MKNGIWGTIVRSAFSNIVDTVARYSLGNDLAGNLVIRRTHTHYMLPIVVRCNRYNFRKRLGKTVQVST